MNAERNRLAQGGAVLLLGQALLIETMASLMDATEQAGGRSFSKTRVVTRTSVGEKTW